MVTSFAVAAWLSPTSLPILLAIAPEKSLVSFTLVLLVSFISLGLPGNPSLLLPVATSVALEGAEGGRLPAEASLSSLVISASLATLGASLVSLATLGASLVTLGESMDLLLIERRGLQGEVSLEV